MPYFSVFLRRLHQNYVVFAEQLNCRYVLLDRLVEEKVITDEERKNILEDETHFKTRIYEYIPEFMCPQVRVVHGSDEPAGRVGSGRVTISPDFGGSGRVSTLDFLVLY